MLSYILDPVSYFHASDHVPEPRVPDQPFRRTAVSADTWLQIHQIPGDEDARTCEFGVCCPGKMELGSHFEYCSHSWSGRKKDQKKKGELRQRNHLEQEEGLTGSLIQVEGGEDLCFRPLIGLSEAEQAKM